MPFDSDPFSDVPPPISWDDYGEAEGDEGGQPVHVNGVGGASAASDASAGPDLTPAGDEQEWRTINVAAFEGKPVPERRWIVPGWLPVGQVTLHYADGGVGKTLLALQLMASTALRKPWCGLAVTPCRSIGMFSEDDTTELHIRLEAIRAHHEAEWREMAAMIPIDATGQDNTLVRFERGSGAMILTPRFYRLREQAMDTKSRLIAIDTAATVFGGNENDRGQVTAFVGGALTKLAKDIDGAVLLNAHPSLSGIANGDLRSGSTAWNNSCRSRWALTRPVTTDDKGKEAVVLDSPERTLTRRKANAATSGDTIGLTWCDGVFIAPAGNSFGAGVRKDAAEMAFLAALRAKLADGMRVSQSTKAGNYAPKVLRATPQGADFTQKELADAMGALLTRGAIKSEPYKRNYQFFDGLVEA